MNYHVADRVRSERRVTWRHAGVIGLLKMPVDDAETA